jgi:glycerate 2-kinase
MSARDDALRIYAKAVEAVDPARLIGTACRLEREVLEIRGVSYDLKRYRAIRLFGAGKAAWPMAEALEELLGGRIASGTVVVPKDLGTLRFTEVVKGSHPVPDEGSLEGARKVMEGMASCGEDELVIFLLSGGSSALMEAPLGAITLEALQDTTRKMLQCDMAIGTINTVRKHLSAVKGGRLGALCKAECAVLVVSDVIGDDLEVIGSAPMYRDRTSFADAKRLLEGAGILGSLAPAVQRVIEAGCAGEIAESPKTVSGRIRHFLIGSNRVALEAAMREAEALGYASEIVTEPLEGDADAKGALLVDAGRKLQAAGRSRCLLYGGETTVRVTGSGKGGRNQQLCLRALEALKADDGLTLLCAGTDGIDGNSDAAGAVVDAASLEKAAGRSLSIGAYLANNDASTFFRQNGDLIVTGPSGTNVMDVAILISQSR